jgi:hypothetical protein
MRVLADAWLLKFRALAHDGPAPASVLRPDADAPVGIARAAAIATAATVTPILRPTLDMSPPLLSPQGALRDVPTRARRSSARGGLKGTTGRGQAVIGG